MGRFWTLIAVLLVPATVYAFGMFSIGTGGGGTTQACTSNVSDDFSGDLSNWTEYGSTSAWAITNGYAEASTKSVFLYTDEPTCSANHWVMAQFIFEDGAAPLLYFRAENDETTYAYVILYDDLAEEFDWGFCGGPENSNSYEQCDGVTAGAWSRILNSGDFVGVDVTGTNNDTVVRVCDLGVSAVSHANWAASGTCNTWTDNPVYIANTGTYIGIMDFDSFTVGFDDVTAGEW